MRRVGMVLIVLPFVAANGRVAEAIASTPLPPHVLDPGAAGDRTPPEFPAPVLNEISRSSQEDGFCGGNASVTSEHYGTIRITSLATDDTTARSRIGYLFSIVAGDPPRGFRLPDGAVDAATDEGSISLTWLDGTTDDHEPFDFTLQLVAIDSAGNESVPQTLRIADDPSGACRIAGGRTQSFRSTTTTLALVGLALLALSLRGRRRAPASGHRGRDDHRRT